MPLLPEYEELFGNNSHMMDALQWIYVDILTFHQHAMRFFHGSSELYAALTTLTLTRTGKN
jgi:hypothetical protein